MTRRATLRGAERTPVERPRADVLICGASFAGLAAARALAGSGLDVLVVDRYEIGERQTSACAIPTPFLAPFGIRRAVRQELPCMTFRTPHGAARHRLPWSWTSFDYRTFCEELWEQCDARFEIAKVEGRSGRTVHTDRGDLTAAHIVDALGWRRILGPDENVQPPEALISRGLEVHPQVEPPLAPDLDVWLDRSIVRHGYAWSVPAGDEQRVGVGSYEPRDHVKEPTKEMARRLGVDAVRYQGNWFPHRLRPAAQDGVFFAGDSAGHCIPLSGEGIRTALYFGDRAGREIRSGSLASYGAFSESHRPFYELAYALQTAVTRIPPRLLQAIFDLIGRPRLCRPAFAWYLRQVPPPSVPRDPSRGVDADAGQPEEVARAAARQPAQR